MGRAHRRPFCRTRHSGRPSLAGLVKLPQRMGCTADANQSHARIARMFQIVRLALDDNGEVDARRPLQPLFELREDAMAMAEFERRGCGATTAATKSGIVGGRPTRADANIASSSNRSRAAAHTRVLPARLQHI